MAFFTEFLKLIGIPLYFRDALGLVRDSAAGAVLPHANTETLGHQL